MRAEDCARLLGANDNGVVAKHHHHRPPRWLVAAGFTTGTACPESLPHSRPAGLWPPRSHRTTRFRLAAGQQAHGAAADRFLTAGPCEHVKHHNRIRCPPIPRAHLGRPTL